ncbi:arylamine N-acetyltransferase family protein [Ovoidimarina sediminis]|uniref:arylamine N-acetyltransferase family protein n=1 Tax=Ovoidimarina sediminis TaxID=3079856 RepID=UPI0029146FD1|nr:arylamine N-acetyltransferase [Rhodophyticola sp. MJ-SS7]MDU8944656.1 arylamine N-acetyltransferase [Rhodophyticola sp. MJ-SS7]
MDGRPEHSVDTLRLIVRQHLRSIPFENLTVLRGNVPPVDRDTLIDKMVSDRRGGYCFELNGLLAFGLEALGYALRPMLARVLWQKDVPGPRNHLFLRVEAEGMAWLADVGFGGPSPDVPIALGAVAPDPYALTEEPGLGTVLSRRMADGRMAALYCFQDELVGPGDIDAANWLAATLPSSIFRSRIVASLGDHADRRTLEGGRFARVRDTGKAEERWLRSAQEVSACLGREFGLSVVDEDERAIVRVLGSVEEQSG